METELPQCWNSIIKEPPLIKVSEMHLYLTLNPLADIAPYLRVGTSLGIFLLRHFIRPALYGCCSAFSLHVLCMKSDIFHHHHLPRPPPPPPPSPLMYKLPYPSWVIRGLIGWTGVWCVYADACCHLDVRAWHLTVGHLKEVSVKMHTAAGVWTYRLFMWLSGTLSITPGEVVGGECVYVCVSSCVEVKKESPGRNIR